MKGKTSLLLSEDLVASIDKLAGPKISRSACTVMSDPERGENAAL
jgi:hypothetical protein